MKFGTPIQRRALVAMDDDDNDEAVVAGASAFYADPTRGTSSGLCAYTP